MTDVARNDYESSIYRAREWLREDENFPYVTEDIREAQIERLTEQEDWLYEDGASANYTTYNNLAKNLSAELKTYLSRKEEHALRETVAATADKGLEAYEAKVEELKTAKPWVTEEERQDVTDKIAEIKAWMQEQLEAQSKLELSEDPIFKSEEAVKKLKQLKKLYGKVNGKSKPKPPKKIEVEEEEEFDESTGEESSQ